MTKECDHTSVGMIVRKEDKTLLIERMKYPFGFAPPAGHVDGDSSFELAAKRELTEEVGLTAAKLKLVFEGRKDNVCRRPDGSWHYWKIYEVEVRGEVKRSEDETKRAGWYTRQEIEELAERTMKYLRGEVSEDEWQKNPGLEVFWYEFGKEFEL
jgi:ADP-ribose pyrophosphatase YjhB (NUDIX family)